MYQTAIGNGTIHMDKDVTPGTHASDCNRKWYNTWREMLHQGPMYQTVTAVASTTEVVT